VEKDPLMNTPIAKASAKCWRTTWWPQKARFLKATGQTPQTGMKLLMRVKPDFHEAYGFSWIVTDIDPTFTLGDMQRRRQEIIETLKQEGVLDLNKQLPLPLFLQHIAVISSPTAAGWGDFQRQLLDNPYGLQFHLQLFPATMQGEQAEPTIIAALDQISRQQEKFQCVVIIRGGGATSDLASFDTLLLAENIANFPLPIITGIGHDRDLTIIDMVAHTHVKTPTAAAELLIERLLKVKEQIDSLEQRLHHTAQLTMQAEKQRLRHISQRLPTLYTIIKARQEALLERLHTQLRTAISSTLTQQAHHLQLLEQKALSLDPMLPLKRGYSITLYKGRPITPQTPITPGDQIETRLASKTLKSTVTEVMQGES